MHYIPCCLSLGGLQALVPLVLRTARLFSNHFILDSSICSRLKVVWLWFSAATDVEVPKPLSGRCTGIEFGCLCTRYDSPSIDLWATRVKRHECNQNSPINQIDSKIQPTLMQCWMFTNCTVMCISNYCDDCPSTRFFPPSILCNGIELCLLDVGGVEAVWRLWLVVFGGCLISTPEFTRPPIFRSSFHPDHRCVDPWLR